MRNTVPGSRGSGPEIVAGRPEAPPTAPRAHPPLLTDAQWAQVARAGGLTKREVDVLKWVTRGLRVRDAARRLRIGTETARGYVREAYKKLGCKGKVDLILRLVHEYWTPVVLGRVQDGSRGR